MDKINLVSLFIILIGGLLVGIFLMPLTWQGNVTVSIMAIAILFFVVQWLLLAMALRPFRLLKITLYALASTLGLYFGMYLSPWI